MIYYFKNVFYIIIKKHHKSWLDLSGDFMDEWSQTFYENMRALIIMWLVILDYFLPFLYS